MDSEMETLFGRASVRHLEAPQNPCTISQDYLRRLLTMAQVQAAFRRSQRTIHRWIAESYLAPLRRGKELLFDPDDVQKVINARGRRAELHRIAKLELIAAKDQRRQLMSHMDQLT